MGIDNDVDQLIARIDEQRKDPAFQRKLDEMDREMEARKLERQGYLHFADQVQKALGKDQDTNAAFLAQICNAQDVHYGLGSQLCLEWMLDHYVALGFERAYPLIKEIHQFLVAEKHSVRNKLRYFNDSEAFYIDPKRIIMVCGKVYRDEPRYLIMDGVETLNANIRDDWHNCYVRKIWQRRKLNSIGGVKQPTLSHYRAKNFDPHYTDEDEKHRFERGWFTTYADGRDPGHVLSYEKHLGKAKCEHSLWDLNAPLSFFFEVNTLWSQTVGQQD